MANADRLSPLVLTKLPMWLFAWDTDRSKQCNISPNVPNFDRDSRYRNSVVTGLKSDLVLETREKFEQEK